jgi:anti-sigma B factor antagonist
MPDVQPSHTGLASMTVVTLPAEIDVANAAEVGAQLSAALAAGGTVIADLTSTTFCDSAGLREILLVHKRAVASGAALRLVMTSAHLLRVFGVTGLDTVLAIFPSLSAAQAAGQAAATGDSRRTLG